MYSVFIPLNSISNKAKNFFHIEVLLCKKEAHKNLSTYMLIRRSNKLVFMTNKNFILYLFLGDEIYNFITQYHLHEDLF